MKAAALEKAARLAAQGGLVLVATADAGGLPHVAAAGGLALLPDGLVEVSAWFCPGTVANLDANRRVSLVAWDPARDEGWQLLGRAERVEEVAILDGWSPAVERAGPLPQVERRIVVRVERVLDFTRRPHSDREE